MSTDADRCVYTVHIVRPQRFPVTVAMQKRPPKANDRCVRCTACGCVHIFVCVQIPKVSQGDLNSSLVCIWANESPFMIYTSTFEIPYFPAGTVLSSTYAHVYWCVVCRIARMLSSKWNHLATKSFSIFSSFYFSFLSQEILIFLSHNLFGHYTEYYAYGWYTWWMGGGRWGRRRSFPSHPLQYATCEAYDACLIFMLDMRFLTHFFPIADDDDDDGDGPPHQHDK